MKKLILRTKVILTSLPPFKDSTSYTYFNMLIRDKTKGEIKCIDHNGHYLVRFGELELLVYCSEEHITVIDETITDEYSDHWLLLLK